MILIIPLLMIDQYTKYLAKHQMTRKQYKYIRFAYVENRGAALGLMKRHPNLLKLFTSSVLIIMVYLYYEAYVSGEILFYRYALLLAISGGLGNLMDRFTRGYVIDFFSPKHRKMPYFNMADLYIFVGVIMLMISSLVFNVGP